MTISVALPSFQDFVESTRSPAGVSAISARCVTPRHQEAWYGAQGMRDSLTDGSSSPSESSEDSEMSSPQSLEDLLMSLGVVKPVEAERHQPSCSKKKKYLTEQQRCIIVQRVLAGERQAHLAREFGVTRAAVSYLLKHQAEILHRAQSSHDL
ncbi:hypothetical protein Poli38472_011710 [Pythium oligandrum]|uniref:HTH psq-type domain-containing protein n=1 Tax=Pythium oligandrum TaxID=41045 RepID=A0A8K1C8X2_PYTOL|nr:hypothetical protein Poli38472_011710 [Pythium oligandrum]|eukprot:TMW58122.1 hypothetical protein Poli38472_011710 [Pythium oligandrum]